MGTSTSMYDYGIILDWIGNYLLALAVAKNHGDWNQNWSDAIIRRGQNGDPLSIALSDNISSPYGVI